MNYRSWYTQTRLWLFVLVVAPGLCSAQLASTNYQVDVYGVGEENAGTATSSQYQIDGAIGPSFERNPSVADVTDETNTSGGSMRTVQEVESEIDSNNPAVTIPESLTQTVPESVDDERSDSMREVHEVPKSSHAYDSSSTSQRSTETDRDISNETRQDTIGECEGLLACYRWMFVGGLGVLGILYYGRRKILSRR